MSGGFPLLIFTEGFGLRRGCVWLSSTWGSDRASGWQGLTLLLCGGVRTRTCTHTQSVPRPQPSCTSRSYSVSATPRAGQSVVSASSLAPDEFLPACPKVPYRVAGSTELQRRWDATWTLCFVGLIC